MENVLAVAVLIEQLSLLGARLLQDAQSKSDPTPAEWQAAADRARAAADRFHALLASATSRK